MKIHAFHIDECDSTNAAIQDPQFKGAEVMSEFTVFSPSRPSHGKASLLWSDYQTAGRGQRGASWESDSGRNLLFSVLFCPEQIEVKRQFRLSQVMSLAIQGVLNEQVDKGFVIKWPNDIYYGERKVCGTIIETQWQGMMVERCILGVGINVNQTCFRSDAPNPISLRQICGRELDRDELLRTIAERWMFEMDCLYDGGEADVARRYRENLMWAEGIHTYHDADGEFRASLLDVEPDGHLVLQTETEGELRRYMFKEVKHVLSHMECE